MNTKQIIESMYKDIFDNDKSFSSWRTKHDVLIFELFFTDGKITLTYFEKIILIFNLIHQKIEFFSGYSELERDSMNSLLQLLNYDKNYYFRYGPSIGFFLEGPDVENKNYDPLKFINAYENNELNESEIVEGFQGLIDTGIIWRLSEDYTKKATMLIQKGICKNV